MKLLGRLFWGGLLIYVLLDLLEFSPLDYYKQITENQTERIELRLKIR